MLLWRHAQSYKAFDYNLRPQKIYPYPCKNHPPAYIRFPGLLRYIRNQKHPRLLQTH